jgi:hypothetical protein
MAKSKISLSKQVALEKFEKFANLPDISVSNTDINSRIQLVRTLEVAIRAMLAKGYSCKYVTEKLLEEFEVEMSPQTLTSYLTILKAESMASEKKQTKRKSKKSSEVSPLRQGKVSSATEALSEVVDSQVRTLLPDAPKSVVQNKVNKKSEKGAPKSVVPKVNSSEKSTVSKTAVPADGSETEEEIEAERRREAEMDKYYNKY